MSDSFEVGTVVEGRFELLSSLGGGGAANVWLAKDTRLNIEVALKVMHAGLVGDPARRADFEREAELCSRMMSPHIVRVLSYGVTTTAAALPYIVYESLAGETLDDRIVADRRPSLEETEDVVVHVARALARAHSMGIVHKDIKPGNIFLTTDDRGRMLAKVLDFGIADTITPATGEALREISGTPEYMPLEVLTGAQADARTDLFALAVVAYECIAGVVPYLATEEISELALAMKLAPPSLVSVLSEEAANPLDSWMRRGLAPDAHLRFQSARELAEEFHLAVRQAKAVLGLIPSAAARRSMPPPPHAADPNRVDTVMPTRRSVPPPPTRSSVAPRHSAPPMSIPNSRVPSIPPRPIFVFESQPPPAVRPRPPEKNIAVEETVTTKRDWRKE